MSVTSVRLSDEILEPLDQLSKVLDRSKNHIINQAIKDYILKHSDEMQHWEETVEALESVSTGNTVDGDSVLEWLESWGSDQEKDAPRQ
ncbi:MAG: CopG family ribbon-helix-helix protein [Endozoicomonas sp.]|uniref:CopG family ribbon-helix-helix protein n=1 Tax=Endozoicomonas sp. TaxID=1892382 RepID=UPI003D9B9472